MKLDAAPTLRTCKSTDNRRKPSSLPPPAAAAAAAPPPPAPAAARPPPYAATISHQSARLVVVFAFVRDTSAPIKSLGWVRERGTVEHAEGLTGGGGGKHGDLGDDGSNKLGRGKQIGDASA